MTEIFLVYYTNYLLIWFLYLHPPTSLTRWLLFLSDADLTCMARASQVIKCWLKSLSNIFKCFSWYNFKRIYQRKVLFRTRLLGQRVLMNLALPLFLSVSPWQKFLYFPSLDFSEFLQSCLSGSLQKWQSLILEKKHSGPKLCLTGLKRAKIRPDGLKTSQKWGFRYFVEFTSSVFLDFADDCRLT